MSYLIEPRNEAKKTKEAEEKQVKVVKSTSDLQRIKLEKLLKKVDKPAFIPDRPTEKLPRVFNPPEFIRNIWGSSAGAGSGDFHVYRGVRRREYARQKYSKIKAESDEKDEAYLKKVAENKQAAEERTAKKRAKRQKKKQAKKVKAEKKKESESEEESEEEN